MPPRIFVTIDSAQLGLQPGGLAELDACVAQFSREHLILRSIAVLHALSADRDKGYHTVNATFARAAGGEVERLLTRALQKDNASFIEPLQQLLLLRRALTVCKDAGPLDITSDAAMCAYFNACRFAADIASPKFTEESSDTSIDQWVKVAAGFSTRLWLTNPVNPNHWVARTRLMLDRLPAQHAELKKYADALKQRFPAAIGLSYDEVFTIVTFLSYWTLGFDLNQIFEDYSRIRLNPDTWLHDTDVPGDAFKAFLQRTARDWTDTLSDSSYGGPLSALPFRDRPFISFRDGTVAPVTREFVLEKLTADIFWWVKDPDVLQQQPWQQDWGYLAEAYVLWLLEKIAASSHCEFRKNVKWDGGELDAAIWFKGHVALVEITSSPLSDDAAYSGDSEKFRAGLHQAFVQSTRLGKAPKAEAVFQLARDLNALMAGKLSKAIPVHVQRIYPVVIALDRRLRTPGAWYYPNRELQCALADLTSISSALVPLNLEDVEGLEQLLHDRRSEFGGTPPGFLRILRRWDTDRGVCPSWWQFMEWLAGDIRPNQHLMEESARWQGEIHSHFKTGPLA